jgi:hypothetical protein
MLSGQTLRDKVLEDIEVAPNVFAIGSLTGDSLIRFAYGSCTYAAGKIMAPGLRVKGAQQQEEMDDITRMPDSILHGPCPAVNGDAAPRVMNGLDGHHGGTHDLSTLDEPLDRRKA